MSHVMRICVVGAATLAALFAARNAASEEKTEKTEMAVAAAASISVVPDAAEKVMPVVSVAPVARVNPMGVEPLDWKVLAKRRGTADVYNDMQLKGVVADNRAVNVTTGNNVITEGAFSGAAGVPMVVQNSGNNVLIQNATIVNVQVK